MGEICSKCFKKRFNYLQECIFIHFILAKPNISNNQVGKSDIKNMDDEKYSKYNKDHEATERNINESNKQTKNTNEEKNIFNLNYDGYFTKDQLEFYRKLYETELFDRRDIKLVKRFKKGEQIGEGSYGKVFQGFDEDQGKLIAIKQVDLNKICSRNLSEINSIENEIEILSKLHNKNIVKYYGLVINERYLDIILEYCIGGSLSKIIKTFKHLSESNIRKYTTQILEGLEYLHSHNIIHSDLKGANILVDRDGTCKLTDFGGSKILKEEIDVKKNSFKGTPNWMAPETVRSMEITRFSDIWSLGCTIIEMATGNPPWIEHKNPIDVLYAIYNINKPPKIPKKISKEMRDFIKCCLKIEPKERWNVHQLLRHPFITGDSINPYSNKNDFEVRFSSRKSGRIFDSINLTSHSNRQLINNNANKLNDIVDTSHIIIKTSKMSNNKIPNRKTTNSDHGEFIKDISNISPDWVVIKKVKLPIN